MRAIGRHEVALNHLSRPSRLMTSCKMQVNMVIPLFWMEAGLFQPGQQSSCLMVVFCGSCSVHTVLSL